MISVNISAKTQKCLRFRWQDTKTGVKIDWFSCNTHIQAAVLLALIWWPKIQYNNICIAVLFELIT